MAVVTYFFICGSCGHKFTANEARCEDWRVPEKSLICPKCETYLEIKKKPYDHLLKWCLLLVVIAIAVSAYVHSDWPFIFSLLVPTIIQGWNSEGFFRNEIETNAISQEKI